MQRYQLQLKMAWYTQLLTWQKIPTGIPDKCISPEIRTRWETFENNYFEKDREKIMRQARLDSNHFLRNT
ncbi:MAG: hypothetical protein ACOCUQ_03320 [Bacteroidota bacterium]